ncbi:la-related protein 6 [Tachyglossus aculeatus]|uniref:la-related protein 6 n=1 Tax=Tachyglossus aculeatus TaxID=9261 RepID=UPI0018F5693E|nr:la-related protein 6 [Tachyglossus aculeatus]
MEPAGEEEMGAWVRIRVAVQPAEEEEEEEEEEEGSGAATQEGTRCHLSASEEEPGRSHSGAATSGGENDGDDADPAWTPPEPELIRKLVDQIEFYFSDENLERDAFLLKHVRRNKRGFVSIKLLTSFKKVKHLTRDWRATAHALHHSAALELDADGRKVRRRAPVPAFPAEHLPGKLLLAHHLHRLPGPAEDGARREWLLAHLLGLFGAFGPIAAVRLLRPGEEPPPDLRRLGGRYDGVSDTECALVEFEEEHAAARAHEALGSAGPGVRVVLIGTKPPKKKKKKEPKPQHGDPGPHGPSRPKSLNRRLEALQSGGDESSANSSSEPDSNPASPRAARHARGPLRLGAPKSPLAEAAAAGRLCPEPPPGTDYSSDSSITPSGSPWVRRRRQARADAREPSPGASPLLPRRPPPSDGCPVGVLRLPRGPDGSRGFRDRPEPRGTMPAPGSGPRPFEN